MSANKPELKSLLTLAFPLMGAQVAQMGMGIVDNVMAGNYDSMHLAGLALGGAVLWPCMMLMMGFLQAVTPVVAQLRGAGKQDQVGEVTRQAFWMALVASGIIVTLMYNAAPFYQLAQVDQATADISIEYLKYSAFGIPGIMGYFVLRYMVEGMGFTKPAMYIAGSALLLKIPLNAVFMYGWLGFEERGGVGCGIATAIVMWLEFLIMIVIASSQRFKQVDWQSKFSLPDFEHIYRLVKIGAPIGATLFFEVGMFVSVTLLLGRYGPEIVSSHTIAMNIGGLTFMFPLALGIAASIRVGFHVGTTQLELARITAKMAMVATLAFAVIAVIVLLLGRDLLTGIYTDEIEVQQLASTLILFVIVFQLFDYLQATAIGALRGYKDTKVPMIITLVGYWFFGMPIALILGFGWFGEPMGVYGFWIGLIMGLLLVAILACARLHWVANNDERIRVLSLS